MTTALGRTLRTACTMRADGLVRVCDFAIVAVDVPISEGMSRVGFVGLVRAEQVHPEKNALFRRAAAEVGLDLVHPSLALEELDLAVFEAEMRRLRTARTGSDR